MCRCVDTPRAQPRACTRPLESIAGPILESKASALGDHSSIQETPRVNKVLGPRSTRSGMISSGIKENKRDPNGRGETLDCHRRSKKIDHKTAIMNPWSKEWEPQNSQIRDAGNRTRLPNGV